jgi:hypothetical protein
VVLAWPLSSVTAAPRATAPSLNCTEPVGALPLTTACSVTVWPAATGLGVALSAMLLLEPVTVSLKAAEVLGALVASPA